MRELVFGAAGQGTGGLGGPCTGRVRPHPGQMCPAGTVFDRDERVDPSAWIRLRNTVSPCTRSTARTAWAWAVRNWRQVGPDRRGAGSMPASCGICHTVEAAM